MGAVTTASEPGARNLVVFEQAGRFGGWPANHGIWSWGDEILVGFEVGYFRASERGHSIYYGRPAEHVLARSTRWRRDLEDREAGWTAAAAR